MRADLCSNGLVDLGLGRNGTIGGDAIGVGMRRAGDPDTDVLTTPNSWSAWGISDGNYSGSADRHSGVPEGMLGLSGFNPNGSTGALNAELFAYTPSGMETRLSVRFDYRPLASPNVYAIDVQVQRSTLSKTTGPTLFDMVLGFDVPPDTGDTHVTWNSATAQIPAFVTHMGCDGYHSGNPFQPAGAPATLGTTCGQNGQGTHVQLNLGDLAVGEQATFTMYVGVTTSTRTATIAIDTIDAALYATAEPASGAEAPGGVVGIFALSPLTHIPATPPPGHGRQ
ncbi:hypothetical protein [Cellulomonas chengniuliangii]|uniref:Uncharacterized protein n=1 Tax=Cellulomonas chengniuliangii TaxID=2968084 RepID=A0ABY5L3T8_9CELL|nr:hypothetical protein [Cellulomonas chengniuliangii]MCC2309170.1 hypothetical protein [Cellulomonas chengniuliangii]UUI75248.1 hypothetical protein NP064_16035 [Cellulomonas chengniuliangii]